MSGQPTKTEALLSRAGDIPCRHSGARIFHMVLAWGAEGVIGARSWFDRYRIVGRKTSDDRDGRGDGSCDDNHFTYDLFWN